MGIFGANKLCFDLPRPYRKVDFHPERNSDDEIEDDSKKVFKGYKRGVGETILYYSCSPLPCLHSFG
jgi:hypothetical protein